MANIKNFGLVGVGSDVQFGKSGPRLKNDTGTFKFRNAGDTGFAAIVADSLTADSLKGNAEQIVKLDSAGKLVLGGALSDLATDSELSAAIAQEVSDRNSAISTAVSPVQTEVNSIETAVGLNSDGTFAAFSGSNYMDSATSIVTALSALDTEAKALADGKLDLAGGTMTGALILNADPTAALGAATKQYVDGKISSLGNAFEYVGTVAGGANSGAAFDLATETTKHAGAYYKVATAGWFVVGEGTPFYANVGDGLVFNTTSGVDIVDNTNSQVQGTTNFITVTGFADTGFTVDVASNFKGRVDTLESSSSALQTEVDAIETSLGTAVATNGTFAGYSGTNYLNSVTSMTGADKALDTALKSLSDTVSGMSLSFTLSDGTNNDTFSTGETLTFTGSADIGAVVSNNAVTFSLSNTGVTAVGTAKIQKITVDTKGRILTSADVTTDDLTQGSTNLYWAQSLFDSAFAAKTTDGLTEGTTNLYFTDARARGAISVTGTGLSYSSSTGVISSNATDANTASTIVARDASGNFKASSPVVSSDVATKGYVDTAIGTAAVNTAHAVYATFDASAGAVSPTIVTLTGRVHRVKVFVDTAASDAVSIQVGTDSVNNDVIATTDVDSGTTGMYIVEVNKNYTSSTTLKVFADNGAVGAVLVEYI